MDDAQFWIYLVFAGFYFLSKMLKKKREQPKPESPLETEDDIERVPQSFEELLAEITGQRQQKKQEEDDPYAEVEEIEEAEPVRKDPIVSVEADKSDDFASQERRKFADAESRRVYEEAIKMAEGSDIEFRKSGKYEVKSNQTANVTASDLRNKLQSPQGVKQAVILGEILNRRY